MTTVGFHTLGCKVNQQETGALAARFQAAGFQAVPFTERADVYVINSCAVTGEAERKSLSLARRQKRRYSEAIVVLAGCFPQVSLEKATEAGVDLLVGSNDKTKIVELVTEQLQDRGRAVTLVTPWSTDTPFEVISEVFSSSRVRATLKVQDGCDQYCAYCIIPYARGRERSLSLSAAVKQGRGLVAQGFREVVLSGIHLGAYGRDLTQATSLANLIAALSDVEGLQRLRLGSVEPNDITSPLLQQFEENSKLCAHIHLPLQSGSNGVLSRMGRRYTAEEYLAVVSSLREARPNIGITTDVMVGFPGESEAEFEETMALVSKVGFSRLHVFRYSRRDGTPAAAMPCQISAAIKTKRAATLQAESLVLALKFNRGLIGQQIEVLLESADGDECAGYTTSYVKAHLPLSVGTIGDIVAARVISATSLGVQVAGVCCVEQNIQ
ncbi:MAG: Threonylcarbamoyladenosine tRNA methylthiotransferase MtaB [Firmicutes bacterium]|nr:Threonylcarbamoyladenosine tRNA methylthiotransferase MtaB [candidate division NPL-UPA2 bacterium]